MQQPPVTPLLLRPRLAARALPTIIKSVTLSEYQHRVLFWGLLGSLVLRPISIATGAAPLSNFHCLIYVFGAFLVVRGVKVYFQDDENKEPKKNLAVRLFERWSAILSILRLRVHESCAV